MTGKVLEKFIWGEIFLFNNKEFGACNFCKGIPVKSALFIFIIEFPDFRERVY